MERSAKDNRHLPDTRERNFLQGRGEDTVSRDPTPVPRISVNIRFKDIARSNREVHPAGIMLIL